MHRAVNRASMRSGWRRSGLAWPLVLLVALVIHQQQQPLSLVRADDGGSSGGSGAGLISPLTRFDAQGRLPQSEAAARAVAKGGPVVAIAAKEAVLLVAPCKPPAPATVAAAGRLVEGGGLPKMWRLGKRTCLSHAGLSQDSRVLLLGAQQAALDHETMFGDGEEMALGEVAEGVATRQQEATMQGNKRPFGASILVAGLVPAASGEGEGQGDERRRRWVPRIYRTDPSGAYTLWRACAIGQNAERAMTLLEERYQPGLSTKAALALALDCCRALQEGQSAQGEGSGEQQDKDPAAAAASAPALDVALISKEGVRLVERLSPPEALLSLAAADDDEGEKEGAEEGGTG